MNGPTLVDAVADGKVSSDDLRLNPAFVEWMMGWPENWTVTVCSSSATGWCRKQLPEPGASCGDD